MRLLTVSTVSYLYQVDILFGSARKIHPEFKLTVLIADCSRHALGPIRELLEPDIDILCTDDLKYDFVENMRNYYSVLEYCSALKILGSAHILETEEFCLFLDPDMVILDSLIDSVINQAGQIVLCAHTFSPYPNDGLAPDDLEMCLSGHLNGGVLLSRRGPQGNCALDWLIDKTKNKWFVSPELGMYADQQWLSQLPYLFSDSITVVSDRGVNVAYWNLHERPLFIDYQSSKIWLTNGSPLRLMHFSGFSIPSNGSLTKHSCRRFDNMTESILVDMILDYETALSISQQRFKYIAGDLGFSTFITKKRIKIAMKFYSTLKFSTLPSKSMGQFLYAFWIKVFSFFFG